MPHSQKEKETSRRIVDLAVKQYKLLENEFFDMTDYIYLAEEHFQLYSYHLMNLLIRISVEFDSIGNTLLRTWLEQSRIHNNNLGSQLKKKIGPGKFFDMGDYRKTFEDQFQASKQHRTLRSLNRQLFPFQPLDLKRTLPWWKAYTSLKHDRIANFDKAATMHNVLQALAALHIVTDYLASAKGHSLLLESDLFLPQ